MVALAVLMSESDGFCRVGTEGNPPWIYKIHTLFMGSFSEMILCTYLSVLSKVRAKTISEVE